MNATEALQGILREESIYQPASEIVDQIGRVGLVAMVAPFAVGKSTISKTICDIDTDFSRVRCFTTRSIRPTEGEDAYDFRGNSTDALRKIATEIKEGQIVQYVVHPTTGDVYGSHADQYATRYCLLEALPGSIPQLEDLPFKSLAKICLAVEPGVWKERVQERLIIGDEDNIKKRLQEGISNIEWALGQNDVSLIDNSTANPYDCARAVVDSVVDENQTYDNRSDVRKTAVRLLNHFKLMLES
ncbi:MAG TPA: hypothetical protein VF575_03640 [Candidatus Saccharimonadales bacterium]|jgi:hypothetical protein